jgi:hypothetical protein
MHQKYLLSLPVPFSTALLDARHCLRLSEQLNDFENAVFGPDFACSFGQIRPWVDSGCLFYSAVCGEAVQGRQTILSAASVLVTTSRSRDRLLSGKIPEHELEPWAGAALTEQATLYFSSVVSDAPDHLSAMYGSLLEDVKGFRDRRGLSMHSAFAIACGTAGRQHMARNGFRLLQGCRYRGTYDFMVIDASTAATTFWQDLLDAETVFFRESPNPEPESAQCPDGSISVGDGACG